VKAGAAWTLAGLSRLGETLKSMSDTRDAKALWAKLAASAPDDAARASLQARLEPWQRARLWQASASGYRLPPGRGRLMSRILRATSVVALSLVFTACAHANHAQDELAIRQLVAVQTEAWNRQDATAWSADYVPDADFINIRGTVFAGREQIAQRHAAIFDTIFKGTHAEVTVRKLVFLGDDVAVVDTTHVVTHYQGLPPGVQATEPGLLRTQMRYVMQRTDGRWWIVAGQNTDEKPTP
jgi:uncharacterized protein (TIGR02246 family)